MSKRAFLKNLWTIEQKGERYFIKEETMGSGDIATGSILIGPFTTEAEAAELLIERHKMMALFFQDVRQKLEASIAEDRKAAA